MTFDFKPLLEAALFVSGRTLDIEELAEICKSGNVGSIRRTIESLVTEYGERNSGLEIYEFQGEYGMRVKKEFEESIMHLVPETDMHPALLKTLALIAYEQPIKQSDVVKERGNRAYKYIKKLREQELIEGKKVGRTRVLSTTPKFRDYFQIQDLKKFVSENVRSSDKTEENEDKNNPSPTEKG